MTKRFELLKPYVEDKKVLDVGCVGGGGCLSYQEENQIHEEIDGVASKTVGIELDEKKIEELSNLGYEVYHKNPVK